MKGNYFFIDGSALTAQIRFLRKADGSFKERRLCPKRFVDFLMDSFQELHEKQYKRMTFYFPKGDEALAEEYILIPDRKKPGEIRDIHFKFCGEKLKKSAEFEKFVDESVPEKFKGRFNKSEKGIDIEICCDAFKLAAASQVDRAFIMTNDDDFSPFFRTIKECGANISMLYLTDLVPPNVSLLHEADSYDVVPIDQLQKMFLPELTAEQAAEAPVQEVVEEEAMSALKADAEPADTGEGMVEAGEVEPEG